MKNIVKVTRNLFFISLFIMSWSCANRNIASAKLEIENIKDENFVSFGDDNIRSIVYIKYPFAKREPIISSNYTGEITTSISSISKAIFSLDRKYVFILTRAWVTSDAIFKYNIETKELTYLSPGNSLEIAEEGTYKGYLITTKHKYFNRLRLGSYDHKYIISSSGEELVDLGGEDTEDTSIMKFESSNGNFDNLKCYGVVGIYRTQRLTWYAIELKNGYSKNIVGFKGKFILLDDFNEMQFSLDIRLDSKSKIFRLDSEKDNLFYKNESIFIVFTMDDNGNKNYFICDEEYILKDLEDGNVEYFDKKTKEAYSISAISFEDREVLKFE